LYQWQSIAWEANIALFQAGWFTFQAFAEGATAIGTTTNKGVEEPQVTCAAGRPSFSG
jgi:hypothetical protein